MKRPLNLFQNTEALGATALDKFMPTIEQVSADERGEIFIVNLPDDRELVLLHSVKGSQRGGHSHNVDEVVVLLSGKMAYHKRRESGQETMTMMQAGDSSFNEAGLIHIGVFLEDSWVVEQKLAKKGGWENSDYEPWRKRVKVNAASEQT